MLKAEQFIKRDTLSQWTQSWDESAYIHYFDSHLHERSKQFKIRSSMEENIVKVKKLCADMDQNSDFNTFMKLMNRIIFNCYFKQSSSALRIANFHEEILVPADQQTRERMFGLQQGRRETGALEVIFENKKIGQLSEQSDMFHLIYDSSFLTEDELFDEKEAILDDVPMTTGPNLLSLGEDVLLTLKIWDPECLNMSLRHFTDLFLYHCSTQLGLNFKRAFFDNSLDKTQAPLQDKVQVQAVRTEKLPLLYFNSASHHLPPAIVFMSYYHAIDYFFERAKNKALQEKMQAMFDSKDLGKSTQLRKMAKTVNSLKDDFTEKEALGLLIKGVLKENKSWSEELENQNWFTKTQTDYPDLPIIHTVDNHSICHSILERIFAIKSSLSEDLDKADNFILIKELDDHLLRKEIPLIKWLAAQTIEIWSTQEAI